MEVPKRLSCESEIRSDSKLKEIGAAKHFEERSIVGLTRLPESLETIGNVAFYAAFSENIRFVYHSSEM